MAWYWKVMIIFDTLVCGATYIGGYRTLHHKDKLRQFKSAMVQPEEKK